MNEHDIAHKYVHGEHDALTDNQEKIDLAEDIIQFARRYYLQIVEAEEHYKQSKKNYDVVGESHLSFYKEKYPENYKKLFNHFNLQK